MDKKTSQLGPVREVLIAKGMIYSPSYGHAAFTMPLFGDFMRRKLPAQSLANAAMWKPL